MKKYVLILVTSLVTTLAFAQSYTEEVDLMQAAFGMAKKEIVSAFVTPSTSQSEAFWTLYDEYETQRKALGKERIALLEQFAQQYVNMTAEQADVFTNKALALQRRPINLSQPIIRR